MNPIQSIKFPPITKQIHYLDNAATTQKPKIVIDTITNFYKKYNANIHRGIYRIAEQAEALVDDARKTFAQLINAHVDEIVFVKSTTEGINQLAQSLEKHLSLNGSLDGKNIVVTIMEHHSNFVPWQQLALRNHAEFRVAGTNNIDNIEEDIVNQIDAHTAIVSFTGMSNATGYMPDVEGIIKKIRAKNPTCIIIIDAAQWIAHAPIDVNTLGADFLCFSAHKLYGTTGIGVVWGKKDLLERIPPFLYGGNMIKEVSVQKTTWADVPDKFEAGTIDAAGIIASAKGIEYFLSNREKIVQKEKTLTTYAIRKLRAMQGVEIIGHDMKKDAKYGPLISFTVEGVHPHDLASICDKHNVCIRAGHHCAQPFMNALGIVGTSRISIASYNNRKDIDTLINAIIDAQQTLNNTVEIKTT